jgi:hypothetical protein
MTPNLLSIRASERIKAARPIRLAFELIEFVCLQKKRLALGEEGSACRGRVGVFARAVPDPTNGSLLGVFRISSQKQNSSPHSKSPKAFGERYDFQKTLT